MQIYCAKQTAADQILCYGWLGITIWYTTTLLNNTFILNLCTFALLTDCLRFCYFTTLWPQWTISLFLLKFFWCRPLFPRVFADACHLVENVTSRFWPLGSFNLRIFDLARYIKGSDLVFQFKWFCHYEPSRVLPGSRLSVPVSSLGSQVNQSRSR